MLLMDKLTYFNIRVYGLLMNNREEVLLTDEYCLGQYMTKFPGGGLELGEGLIDGLKREFMEELNIPIQDIRHFYTTDFFQLSAYRQGGQLISVYYIVKSDHSDIIPTVSEANENLPEKEGSQVFRWKAIKDLTEAQLTWPVDKHVVNLLKDIK
jgi:8-oxo-dGTP pyrophosphatase MutT (NUDIX family)